jgi:segregation and condensation protein B
MLFAAAEPLSTAAFAEFLPTGVDVAALLADLAANYENRGVNIVQVAGKFALRTAPDMGSLLRREKIEQKRLTKAALETLSIVAYHQPVTRAEIEDIRGVAISKGTLDNLLEIGWVKMRGRRKTPGRPVTYGTTEAFLSHFGLNELTDLPGLQELKAAGLLDANVPPGFDVPMPKLSDALTADEEPLDGTEQMPLEMHLPDDDAAPDSAEG